MAYSLRRFLLFWIIRNQFGRRNLEIYTRAQLALKLEVLLKPIIEAKAKEKIKTSTGGTAPRPLQNSAKAAPINTRAELAKAAGVSHDTLKKVRVIDAKASEEVKAALRAGETTINAEHKRSRV